jgi:GTP-binding protein EngB required for normal cell division
MVVFKSLFKRKYNFVYPVYPTNQHMVKSILEENFLYLERIIRTSEKRSVAIIGQPGAGKSSLLLKLTNGQCEPKPLVGQHTDATDWSNQVYDRFLHIFNQISFIDSPGYGTKTHPINSYREYFPFHEFDGFLFVIKGKIQSTDEEMFRCIIEKSKRESNVVLVRAFSDDLTEEDRKHVKQDCNLKFRYTRYNCPLVFVSNRLNQGIKKLQTYLQM